MKAVTLLVFLTYLFVLIFSTAQADKDIDKLLRNAGIRKTIFNLNTARNGNIHVTNLDDNARDFWQMARRMMFQQTSKNWNHLYRLNWNQGKIQRQQHGKDFPCQLNGTRSLTRPTNVHEIRPGDIDMIASIGDSLSAGVGVMSQTVLDDAIEFRSLSFSGGGAGDWRTYLTLPNILKVFNPDLYGYSTANVVTMDKESYFNIAENILMSRDLVYQVQTLLMRIQKDPRVDMKNHWKLLTIYVGMNDICTNMCHYDNLWDFLQQHEQNLREALTLLRDNVPRLIINLMSPQNLVKIFQEIKNMSLFCQLAYTVGCSCLQSVRYDQKYLSNASKFIQRFQGIDEKLASLPEFQTKDFIILYQTFTANMSYPTMENGNLDMRYFAADCAHLSQLGQASMANALWNNMLQAPDQKHSKMLKPFVKFECPTEERPYIATFGNNLLKETKGIK